MFHRLILYITIGALASVVLLTLNPVSNTLLKLAFLAALLTFWSGLIYLIWNRRPARLTLLLLPVIPSVLLLLPARPVDTKQLTSSYLRNLTKYESVRYVWGGESFFGIDCSGLPRRALRDALLTYGLSHLNSNALRTFLQHWWFDASALALSKGYRNCTTPVGTSGTIKTMDYTNLLPGDLAITRGGAHLIVYLGNDQWIQADNEKGKVLTQSGRTDENGWFHAKVTTHRWNLISSPR
ncbi:NlpC/P60 family protein [Phragmitibacter flavus]|uniref:NlpC/P60 family protein n=1 Tax=Phragmitibacter flavus TaxID=2576071 RepID=A0A5R8KB24_9BACT|nr:NlpC/P60 family protein [Phragmitibacter flavus]TLD68739.1 NlpC/P60 family protein [Phragmitibacter flavus]